MLRVTIGGLKAVCKKLPEDTETIVKVLGKCSKLLDETVHEEGYGIGGLKSTYDVFKTKILPDVTD